MADLENLDPCLKIQDVSTRCTNREIDQVSRGCFNLSYKERDSDDPRLTQIHGYILSPLYKPGHATVFFDSPQNRVSEYRKIDFRIFLFFRILSISKRIQ